MKIHVHTPFGISIGISNDFYLDYLTKWRNHAIERAEQGIISASLCHQAALIDIAIFGRMNHDWLGIMDDFLTQNGEPVAYSEKFGNQLHKFNAQLRQSSIHAIYTRWWIESLNGPSAPDPKFKEFILNKKQSDGLFYDRDISETTLRHRMKTELMMSTAMSIKILMSYNCLSDSEKIEICTNVVDPLKCPSLGYISMEYFRLQALKTLGHVELFPIGIENSVQLAATDLAVGWCDFAMSSKVDAYMGTAKRVQRDKPIHSPLIACYIQSLLEVMDGGAIFGNTLKRFRDYCVHLEQHPDDIPAFQMRDIPIKFGAGITPIEVICASYLVSLTMNGRVLS